MSLLPSDPNDTQAMPPNLRHAIELISALCDEHITPAQFDELQLLVCNDRDVRKFYVQMMHLHSGLYYFASAIPDVMASSGSNSVSASLVRLDDEADGDGPEDDRHLGMNETMVLPAMKDPVEVCGDEDLPLPEPAAGFTSQPADGLNRNLIKGSIAAGLAIFLGFLAYLVPQLTAPRAEDFTFAPPVSRPLHYVATLELTSSPVWETPPLHDSGFVAGDFLRLQGGAVQLRLTTSSQQAGRVVVEGPAEIRFVSDAELRLNYGRIVARYPGGGLIVRCPTGSIQDLGTEFGVRVDPKDGNSEVDVFEGKVAASISRSVTPTTRPVKPLIIKVGQAAVLSQTGVTQSPRGAIPQQYICNLSNQKVSSLDVTDLISGGDGTTRRRGIAIDSTTGAIGVLNPVGLRAGDGKYHTVHDFPFVDGAFVPDGTNGPMTVDSVGHQFQFTPTLNSATNHIWTGGDIPWGDTLGISTVIGDVDYASAEHSIICTHCDNGITLDLDAVRRIYPDRALKRFHSHFANSYVNGLKGASKVNPVSSVYVLVDGAMHYQKLGFTNQDGMFNVDVPLAKTDRFLTLAAVDDGKDIDRDWILWTDAKLDLASPN